MIASERQETILQLLSAKGFLSTNELCQTLNVSPATIRNDLNTLSKKKLLIRSHGGAAALTHKDLSVKVQPTTSNILPSNITVSDSSLRFKRRAGINGTQKNAIAQKALSYIQDNQCILLDASTTSLALAKLLGKKFNRLLVVTNGIYNMLTLKDYPNITTAIIGGIVTPNSGSVEGILGADILKNFHIDVAFLSSYGFTLKEGLTDFNLYEVELKKEMLKASNRVIALVDSSKFGHVSVASFMESKDLDTIITDDGVDQKTLDDCKNAGIHVDICSY